VSEWRFARKGNVCSVCSRAFEPEEPFVSAIYRTEEGDGAFERLDACPSCFEEIGREPYSRWMTSLPADARKEPVLDLSTARDFLLRLAEEDRPEHRPLMHILALLLLRKRKVRLAGRRTVEEGPVLDLVVRTEDGDVEVTLLAVPPTPEEEEDLQEQVGRLFGG
jgi:hypothetical protein